MSKKDGAKAPSRPQLEHAQTILEHDAVLKLREVTGKETTKDALYEAAYFTIEHKKHIDEVSA